MSLARDTHHDVFLSNLKPRLEELARDAQVHCTNFNHVIDLVSTITGIIDTHPDDVDLLELGAYICELTFGFAHAASNSGDSVIIQRTALEFESSLQHARDDIVKLVHPKLHFIEFTSQDSKAKKVTKMRRKITESVEPLRLPYFSIQRRIQNLHAKPEDVAVAKPPSTPPPSTSAEVLIIPKANSQFAQLWSDAIDQYQNLTKRNLDSAYPADASVEDVHQSINDRMNAFEEYSKKGESTRNVLGPVLTVTKALSDILGEAVALAYPPAKAIFVAMGFVVGTVKHYISQYEEIAKCFSQIHDFMVRVQVYVQHQITLSMQELLAKFFAQMLLTLGTLETWMHNSFARASWDAIVRPSYVEDALKKLDDLSNNEQHLVASVTLTNTAQLIEMLSDSTKESLHTNMLAWLEAPDPSLNFNSYNDKHCWEGSGEWFLRGEQFSNWKGTPNSFLWLHGKPGCGKSVLSSTIIQSFEQQRQEAPLHVFAYFYFDFRDPDKLSPQAMLTSLIAQFCGKYSLTPPTLVDMYNHYGKGSTGLPSAEDLFSILQDVLGLFRYVQHIYVVLDGLDECSVKRAQILDFLRKLNAFQYGKLHLLLTSRDERDIRDVIVSIPGAVISSLDTDANNDIPLRLAEVLDTDDKLKTWPADVKENIQQSLTKRADGMFRWVYLQLESLRFCETIESLELTLDALPDGLDETYDRILQAIPACHHNDVKRILQFLAFSVRPLTLVQLAEVVTVNLDIKSNPRILEKRRFRDIQAIKSLLSDLISTVVVSTEYQGKYGPFSQSSECIILSHFTVKEYLVSQHILRGSVPQFGFDTHAAHILITGISLNYLLHFQQRDLFEVRRDFPLALYAARFWMNHCLIATACTVPDVLLGVLILFLQRETVPYAAMTLLRDDPECVYNSQWYGQTHAFSENRYVPPPALCLVAEAGLLNVASVLLESGADVNTGKDSALFLAARQGHSSLVRLLLSHGAKMNLESSSGQTALQVATARGDEIIVEMLLSNGANPNLRRYENRTALQEASILGHVAIARLLLESGADVNAAPAGLYGAGTALQQACSNGDEDIVRLLVNSKADLNAEGTEFGGIALERAVKSQNEPNVLLLLKNGADVNGAGGKALQAAVKTGSEALIRLLLEHGADAGYGLVEASQLSDAAVVSLLLDNGADANHGPAGYYGNALQSAAHFGNEAAVLQLLKAGAQINAAVGSEGTALREAVATDHETIIQLLLENGADVNMRGWDDQTPLQAAVARWLEGPVRLLLKYGADVNAKGAKDGTALRLALAELEREVRIANAEEAADSESAVRRLGRIVQLLLKYGAVE